MSDKIQVQNARKVPAPSGRRQVIFNVIGWAAFLLLVPPVLKMVNYPQVQNLAAAKLGSWGSELSFIIYFYALLFLRAFFGSDQKISVIMAGFAMSFLLFSISLDIGFMSWLKDLAKALPFMGFPEINFVVGVFTVFLANALSVSKRIPFWLQLLFIIALPAAALFAAGTYLAPVIGL